jgi:hypothetical protein
MVVRYLTHQFAHLETLERAKRWLVQAGIDASRIEARTQGILSLAIAVEAGESAEVQRVIDAAESSDPAGNPGIWDRAWRQHVYPQAGTTPAVPANPAHSESIVVGWRPQDAEREVTQTDTETELQKNYREGKD